MTTETGPNDGPHTWIRKEDGWNERVPLCEVCETDAAIGTHDEKRICFGCLEKQS